MSILNQAAVEALCSATYLENYLETMENLPDDLQRVVSQLRELDIKCRGKTVVSESLHILIKLMSALAFYIEIKKFNLQLVYFHLQRLFGIKFFCFCFDQILILAATLSFLNIGT